MNARKSGGSRSCYTRNGAPKTAFETKKAAERAIPPKRDGSIPIPVRNTAGTLATDSRATNLRRHAPLALTLVFMVLVVALLVAAGFYVRNIVRSSFRDAEAIRVARTHVADMLNAQLDEETGMRGYVAAREPILLAPYYVGRRSFPAAAQRVGFGSAPPERHRGAPAAKGRRRSESPLAARSRRSADPYRTDQPRGWSCGERRSSTAFVPTALRSTRRSPVAPRSSTRAPSAQSSRSARWRWPRSSQSSSPRSFSRCSSTGSGSGSNASVAQSEAERRRSAEARAAYAAEKRIADTLQQAFSERVFPNLPTMSFSATYLPATEESKVGGDWYDALELPDERVLLVIGDVTGHGIDAVIAMNRARQLIIGSALIDADPAALLARANLELVRVKSPLITAACAVVDTRTYAFSYAVAGHPPPVLLEPGRQAALLEFGSLPLGVCAKTTYATRTTATVPGAMIVLYTDGVIEYARDLEGGEAALIEAIESAASVPRGQAAKAIRDRIFSRSRIADDIAILTARLWEAPVTSASPRRIA